MMATVPVVNSPKVLKKPNKDEYEQELKKINETIEKLKAQNDVVKKKIEQLPAKAANPRRDEINARLTELQEKQAVLKAERQDIYRQRDAINESIRKKVGRINSLREKVPFKSATEVDAHIKQLEEEIASGLSIAEEKRRITRIRELRSNRENVENLDNDQAAIDRERELYNDLKKKADSEQARAYSDEYKQLAAERDDLRSKEGADREKRNKLYDERTRLKGLLDKEFASLRTLRDEHRKANDDYYNHMRQVREQRKEQEKTQKAQYEKEKRLEAAKQEIELASVPAYENEIQACDRLIQILEDEIAKRKLSNQRKKTLTLPLTTLGLFSTLQLTSPSVSEMPETVEKIKAKKEQYVTMQPQATEENKRKANEKYEALLKKVEEGALEDSAESTQDPVDKSTPTD